MDGDRKEFAVTKKHQLYKSHTKYGQQKLSIHIMRIYRTPPTPCPTNSLWKNTQSNRKIPVDKSITKSYIKSKKNDSRIGNCWQEVKEVKLTLNGDERPNQQQTLTGDGSLE